MSELRVAVVGLGFMGRTHVRAWQAAAAEGARLRLAAVCDQDAGRLDGKLTPIGNLPLPPGETRLFDPAQVRGYSRFEELLADKGIDALSLCTPTDTHVELAQRAIAAGKHVLVEKPVALASADIDRLALAARGSGRVCMPAHCMRFWPGWGWLREKIASGAFGRVRSAAFQRLGTMPSWSTAFYSDLKRSGGALFDLHVHDVDILLWCFGPPRSVVSTGSAAHVSTLYRYDDGPAHVVAEGGVDQAPGFGFRMRYTVVFEQATAEFDLMRDPQLQLARDGKSHPVPLDGGSLGGYLGEVREFARAIGEGRAPAVTLEDAALAARVLEAERASLERRCEIELDLREAGSPGTLR